MDSKPIIDIYIFHYLLVLGTSSQVEQTSKHRRYGTIKQGKRNTDFTTIFLYHTPNKKGDQKEEKKRKLQKGKRCS